MSPKKPARKATKKKPGIKKLSRRPAADEMMGHNRRVNTFDRRDAPEWPQWDPFERLVAEWKTDAEVLRKTANPELARLVEKHASDLKAAVRQYCR